MSEFSVPLSELVERLGLDKVYIADNYEQTKISTVEINRPGLELTGYFEFFDNKRIQVLGNTDGQTGRNMNQGQGSSTITPSIISASRHI